MRALASPISPRLEVTGLSCPECFGVLAVQRAGSHGVLRFCCRIGHAYSATEVVVGKEKYLEEHLWAAVTALDELATLLRELVAVGNADDPPAFERRARTAERQQERLREVLQQTDPIAIAAAAGTGDE